jgi:hypothetical protein
VPDVDHELRTSPPTVFLHIGTPKSGTTYLQSRMELNHERAAAQGMLWPGGSWDVHVRAADELRELEADSEMDPSGPWMQVAGLAREWTGPSVLISMEWLAKFDEHQITAAVDSLAPCRVEVICTARDLLRSFTAQWQEMTKNYRPWPWSQFVSEVVEERPNGRARTVFWSQQDIPEILRRWATSVPVEQIHLVTVPPQGADRELLWRRYCEVIGIDGADFAPPEDTNESLGVTSSVLMQRLNREAQKHRVDFSTYHEVFHRRLARQVLARHRVDEAGIAVPADVDAWLRERSASMLDEIKSLGVHVHGELDDLVPGPTPAGRQPSEVDDTELLGLALDAMVSLGTLQIEELRSARLESQELRRAMDARRLPARARRLARRGRRVAGRVRENLRSKYRP